MHLEFCSPHLSKAYSFFVFLRSNVRNTSYSSFSALIYTWHIFGMMFFIVFLPRASRRAQTRWRKIRIDRFSEYQKTRLYSGHDMHSNTQCDHRISNIQRKITIGIFVKNLTSSNSILMCFLLSTKISFIVAKVFSNFETFSPRY